MSTFGGLIEEIPGISVDRFDGENLKSSIFFLSHCHTDHMKGLLYTEGQYFIDKLLKHKQYLYCTPVSKKILEYKLSKFGSDAEFIKTIDCCSPVIVDYTVDNNKFYLTVTCIPAGHCPGSVMFLFENEKTSVLYTGDFRIGSSDLSKLKPLHNDVNNIMIPKKFDSIYIDTTFFNPINKFFPSRRDSVKEICRVANDWIRQDVNNIVVLECSAHYGPEYLFIELSNALNLRIHVKNKVYESYTFVPELSKCVTNDPQSTPIHACMNKLNRYSNVVLECRRNVEFKSVITIVPSVFRWKDKDVTKGITEWDGCNNKFNVCYSCHSSYDELVDFINYFKPNKLYPCVVPKEIEFEDFSSTLNKLLENSKEANDYFTGYDMDLSKPESLNDARVEACNLSDVDDD
ncbi:protein artemis isoform X1 [Microplitis demolitor]|uniref:protein artemis isoform X1 n=1 Tax=Microplitis demolitor TaxID=69319 RepID=UPI0004CD6EFB|nr:protein artemis isoform X1 [Microplitis demolitor]